MILRIKKGIGFGLVLAMLLGSCAKPIANFSYENSEKTAPAKVTFSNESKKAETYEWDFGDGKTSTEPSPAHQYFKSGKYTITLKATKEGKTSKKEKTITVEPPEDCLVEIETSLGNMIVLLYEETPLHRDNFLKLAEQAYFDGLIFHRVINGFMIQGGDPKSKNAKPNDMLGSGGPGYTVPAEFIESLVHTKGALAAARQGDAVNPEKRSSGSQFYIVQGTEVSEAQLNQVERSRGFKYTDAQKKMYVEKGGTPHLDKEYTVFGQVISGMEVIDKIAAVETDRGRGNRPKEDVKMKITVIK